MCVSCPAPAALNPQTVVELFYQTAARRLIVSQLFSNQQGGALLVWTDVISSVVQLLAQLLYPSSLIGLRLFTLSETRQWSVVFNFLLFPNWSLSQMAQ